MCLYKIQIICHVSSAFSPRLCEHRVYELLLKMAQYCTVLYLCKSLKYCKKQGNMNLSEGFRMLIILLC